MSSADVPPRAQLDDMVGRVFHPGEIIPSFTWVCATDLPLVQTTFEERVRAGSPPRYEVFVDLEAPPRDVRARTRGRHDTEE